VFAPFVTFHGRRIFGRRQQRKAEETAAVMPAGRMAAAWLLRLAAGRDYAPLAAAPMRGEYSERSMH